MAKPILDPPDPEVNPMDGFKVGDYKYTRQYVGQDERIAVYVKDKYKIHVTADLKVPEAWYAIQLHLESKGSKREPLRLSIIYALNQCTNENMEELIR